MDDAVAMKVLGSVSNWLSGTPGYESEYVELFREQGYNKQWRVFQDIIGHPHNAPSLREIDYMNPTMTEEDLSGIVEENKNRGILEEIELPETYAEDDFPDTFYTFTNHGWDVIEPFTETYEEEIREEYSKVRKPDHIQRFESLPRPRT